MIKILTNIIISDKIYELLRRVFMSSLNMLLSNIDNIGKEGNFKKITAIKKSNIYDLIQFNQYVGEIVNLAYGDAKVQINDAFRKKVGGVPSQCFLVASRITQDNIDEGENFFDEEDCSVILLRVIDSANLPGDMDKERILVENAERNHGNIEHWDSQLQDPTTKKILSFGAVKCRVIGTFYMEYINEKGEIKKVLKFGNDLSNFYPNRGLKVYKPNEKALESIVNFGVDLTESVELGKVRYSSTNRKNQGVSEVNVVINPTDLVSQKTAVFGMTRSGKSNTVKIIAKSIYQLRFKSNKEIGQIIFDANGEYANDNTQDDNSALKNVWKIKSNGQYGSEKDVKTYGLIRNKNDPKREIMKINFYDDELMSIGKELMDNDFLSDKNSNVQYVRNFINVTFNDVEKISEQGEKTRELRKRLIYKTLLFQAGFKDDSNGNIDSKGKALFSKDLIDYLKNGIKDFDSLSDTKQRDLKKAKESYNDCAVILEKFNNQGSTYAELATAFKKLLEYSKDSNSTYSDFERQYLQSSTSGMQWLDVNVASLLEMFNYSNSTKRMARSTIYHDIKSKDKDYVDKIYTDLSEGKLVIIDQALGDSDLNRLVSERILRKIFYENSKQFSNAEKPTPILIYIEEAHNLMPKGSEEDTTNIWARVAKEGAKFNIGMIYSTQEVSSIQKNILKNTTNWFISHLNNKEEIKVLSDYYDFEDFSLSILQSEDKGFIRMKTLSNRFVVPIQVDKFEIKI
jgi:hypothetical protein